MTADEDWPRLARFVRARRDELGMSQEDVRAAGGPSTATINLIENPDHRRRAGYSQSTYSKLDRALRWQPMSARTTLKGGEPRPLHAVDQLGEQLRRQCILLGDRLGRNYRNRSRFAAERFGGMPQDVAYDLAYRAEHDPSALSEGERAAVERAYGLAGGSLTRSLTTGILEPAPGEAPSLADETAELERTLAWLGAGDRDEQDRKLGLILRRLRTPGPGAEGMRDTGSQAESA